MVFGTVMRHQAPYTLLETNCFYLEWQVSLSPLSCTEIQAAFGFVESLGENLSWFQDVSATVVTESLCLFPSSDLGSAAFMIQY